jgi:hypothetical protein
LRWGVLDQGKTGMNRTTSVIFRYKEKAFAEPPV